MEQFLLPCTALPINLYYLINFMTFPLQFPSALLLSKKYHFYLSKFHLNFLYHCKLKKHIEIISLLYNYLKFVAFSQVLNQFVLLNYIDFDILLQGSLWFNLWQGHLH